ncbi:uncharacterized protein MELLADRAFT_73656 [Melampsora larici-populina 98AG31]|uniref:Uncharacterized protein n=1 Tax=Melampsora larici-populina (strain 98AG31 / pathotype 3-4-7) TaxID=747676 RepID=F4SB64_MELLP|nr:uncharacterized protein MELLADRAFT_73656 [Melampsora larici-populina 98AG31]EGF98091.1 hypothetical protein MELLADRAFT_73656 [Melampsora larici-populina 98AG31]
MMDGFGISWLSRVFSCDKFSSWNRSKNKAGLIDLNKIEIIHSVGIGLGWVDDDG